MCVKKKKKKGGAIGNKWPWIYFFFLILQTLEKGKKREGHNSKRITKKRK